MISRINHTHEKSIDVFLLDSISINKTIKKPTYVINRFNSYPIELWINEEKNKLIKTPKENVYELVSNFSNY